MANKRAQSVAQSVGAQSVAEKPFDTVGFIMDYEAGELDEEAVISGFQHLIDSGVVWQLQGSYGRMAARLIQSGDCHG